LSSTRRTFLGIAGDHHDVDAGVTCPHLAQHGRQQVQAHGQPGADAHLAADPARMGAQRLLQPLQRQGHGRQLRQQGLPCRRGHGAPAHTLDQARAQMALQLPQLQADRRLGQLQQRCGLGKAAFLHHQAEAAQQDRLGALAKVSLIPCISNPRFLS
jgi:hypothetical protein